MYNMTMVVIAFACLCFSVLVVVGMVFATMGQAEIRHKLLAGGLPILGAVASWSSFTILLAETWQAGGVAPMLRQEDGMLVLWLLGASAIFVPIATTGLVEGVRILRSTET